MKRHIDIRYNSKRFRIKCKSVDSFICMCMSKCARGCRIGSEAQPAVALDCCEQRLRATGRKGETLCSSPPKTRTAKSIPRKDVTEAQRSTQVR